MEEKLIEEEVARRVEAVVAKRVEEEMEKRKEEIEAEVLRRIEDAKRAMEAVMLAELERKRQAELKEQQIKEVQFVDRLYDGDVDGSCSFVDLCCTFTDHDDCGQFRHFTELSLYEIVHDCCSMMDL